MFLDGSRPFQHKALLACKTDTSQWKDIYPEHIRPAGDAEVLVGYDPRGGGQGEGADDAGLVVSLKRKKRGVFRFLERVRLKGSSYEEQAKTTKDMALT